MQSSRILSERMKKDRWVLGEAGRADSPQSAIRQSRQQLARSLWQRFHRCLAQALEQLKLKKLLADKPKYQASRAVSAPTSPLRLLLESIRDETMLTRERPKPANTANAAAPTPDPKMATVALLFNTQDGPPGAKIEAQFKPYYAVLEGDSTRGARSILLSPISTISLKA